jgi:CRISPR-associated endonuclease/helicase Cas3
MQIVDIVELLLETERSNSRKLRITAHPSGGCLLLGMPAKVKEDVLPPPDLDNGDVEDSLSYSDQPVTLKEHTRHVVRRTHEWANNCLPASLVEVLSAAAELHDLGKADPRFQFVLHGDEVEAAIAIEGGDFLAKSDGLYRAPVLERQLRQAAGLPDGFRHEMLSMQLVEQRAACFSENQELRDLLLHLIASHHGHGRAFAPVVLDEEPPGFAVGELSLTDKERKRLAAEPPHRVDSGVADRFWRLTRRFGWWGLAYVEAVLRLADRNASASETLARRRLSRTMASRW